jgi:hypothetical protein
MDTPIIRRPESRGDRGRHGNVIRYNNLKSFNQKVRDFAGPLRIK